MLPSLTPVISDTAETGVSSKGAGIQTSSLIFLLKFLADNHPQRHNARQTFFWAVEEPESFLHPSKQREMANVMATFAGEVQTVITTHSPHFVLRDTRDGKTYVVDKHTSAPHSTHVVGSTFDLARQTLGVTLLDSMSMFPLNIVVEGPSDEIIFGGTLRKLASSFSLRAYDVKFFPAGNASSAAYLFESLRAFSEKTVPVRLIVDGDEAGLKAINGLNGRGKRDGHTWKSNQDYFQLPLDAENLFSDRVKSKLAVEAPGQVTLTRDTDGNIRSFVFNDGHKKSLAERAIELSEEADLVAIRKVLQRVIQSIAK